ncbi:MAG TPA: hypothetical protein VK009_19615 [Chloroflexota bacterium]|nr:hypothetical protein [Chloroflexota bacterium]
MELFVDELGAFEDVFPEGLPAVEPLWLPLVEPDVLVLLLCGAAGGILLTETEADGDWLPLLLPELELVWGAEELLWLAVDPDVELDAGPSATAVETGRSTSAAIVSRLAAMRWGIRLRTDPRRQARRSGRAGSVIYSLSLRQNCRRPAGLPAVPR